MPQDDQSSNNDTAPYDYAGRIKSIRSEVDYYKAACVAAAGHFTTAQPPTIYAAKYVEDMEFLLGMLKTSSTVYLEPIEDAPPPPKTELEKALEHDQAGRTERRKR